MKRTFLVIIIFVFAFCAQNLFSQTTKRLGDLEKSDSSLIIYQIYGLQESAEGYRITYITPNNEAEFLYVPFELLDKVNIYSPKQNTLNQNFLVIWKQEDRITRVDWYQPAEIDYTLPSNQYKAFSDKDKEIFKTIVANDQLLLGSEIEGSAPRIRAPGSD